MKILKGRWVGERKGSRYEGPPPVAYDWSVVSPVTIMGPTGKVLRVIPAKEFKVGTTWRTEQQKRTGGAGAGWWHEMSEGRRALYIAMWRECGGRRRPKV